MADIDEGMSGIDERIIDCLMRQTNYTKEQAIESIQRNKTLDVAIKEYLGVTKKEPEMISVNQGIFKAIREFIDN